MPKKSQKAKRILKGQPTWVEAKKRPKGQIKYFKPTNFKQGQISEILG